MIINYTPTAPLTPKAIEVLKRAKATVFGDEPVRLEPVTEGGVRIDVGLYSSYQMAHELAVHMFRRAAGLVLPYDPSVDTLYLDIETHNEGRQWGMTPREFFRLGQYAWSNGPVVLTTDYDEVIAQIRKARVVVAHNGHPFDLSVLFGRDSMEALEMANKTRILDTMVLATQTLPAPTEYHNRQGHKRVDANKPGNAMVWLSLDNLCFQLGLEGKSESLKDLAKEFNPPGTYVDDYDYGLIPVDDERFRAYAIQDVEALRELTHSLLDIRPMTEYDWREQLIAGINAQITRNGFKVDLPVAQARADELTANKERILSELEATYDFPTEGKSPWASNAGKAAIFKALADAGITEETVPDWTRTKAGALSLGGEVLLRITQGTPAQELGQALAQIKGQRSLAQLAIDSTHEDGFTHPQITSLQRSGRFSLTKPGLTVWSEHADGGKDKSYFIADNEDELLLEIDFSNADARAVAAYSGDTEFMKRFEPGMDGHNISGEIFFGAETYYSELNKKGESILRPTAKAASHALSYRVQAPKLASVLKLDVEDVQKMIQNYYQVYPDVLRWQNDATDEGRQGFVVNAWGRRMIVDISRSYTQSPALYGQSATRELLCDGLIRLYRADPEALRWIKATIHDAVVFSVPKTKMDYAREVIRTNMETTFCPEGGQAVPFPIGMGEPARDWRSASHG